MIAEALKALSVPIDSVKLDPRNARQHPEPNLEALKRSLEAYGQRKPIVVNQKGRVIEAGNGLWSAAKALGWPEIAAVFVEDSDDMAKGFAVMDNQSALLADWDLPVLKDILQELDTGAFDMDLTGFDEKAIEELMTQFHEPQQGKTDDDEIPEAPEPKCKPGELWLLGNHRLLCGDSTKPEDVARLMDGEKVVLCFTSPPYVDARDYGGRQLDTKHLASVLPLWAEYSRLLVLNLGILRCDNAVLLYWNDYLAAADNAGLKLLSWNVWDRGQPWSIAQNTAMFPLEHEWIFVFGEQRKRLHLTVKNKTPGMRTRITNRQRDGGLNPSGPKQVRQYRPLGSVFRSPPHIGRDIGHPAMYPVALPIAYTEAVTSDSDAVADPFLGSGTTLIACEKLNRRCYGMEIEPRYCDVILQRWANYTGRDPVREDGTNWSEL